jgi:hypothetical protein
MSAVTTTVTFSADTEGVITIGFVNLKYKYWDTPGEAISPYTFTGLPFSNADILEKTVFALMAPPKPFSAVRAIL